MKKLFSVVLMLIMLCTIYPAHAYAGQAITVSNANGVVGSYDIGSDFTTAIKNAADYCRSNASSSSRLTITVPNGNYTIWDVIVAPSFTTIDLGGSTVTLDGRVNCNVLWTEPNASGYSGCNGFRFCNGTIRFDNDMGYDLCLVRVGHAQNIEFENLTFRSSYNCHLMEIGASRNVVVKNCVYDGIDAKKCTDDKEALQIDVLNDEHFPGYYQDGTSNDNITVTGCTFKNASNGVGTNSLNVGFYQNNINITNNTFSDLSCCAIMSMCFVNSNISGNSITNCGSGIHYFLMKPDSKLSKVNYIGNGKINTNANSVISNNSISVAKTKAVSIASPIFVYGSNVNNKNVKFPKGNYYVSNVSVSGNSVNSNGYGIRFSDVKNSVIENNYVTVSSSDVSAIALSEVSCNNRISGNTTYSGKIGISAFDSSNDNLISGNTVNNAIRKGIVLESGTYGNSITYNAINSSGEQGIFLDGASTPAISYNKITSSGHNAINIKGPCTINEINYNEIYGANGTGICLEAGINIPRIVGNNISNCKKFGIKTISNVNVIEGNVLANNKDYGLCLDKGVKSGVYKNTYTKNKGAGKSVGSKSVLFTNLGTAKISSVKKSKKNAVIKWKKVSNASKYEIYRATSKNGKYTKIATVNALSYTDKKAKKGKKNYYKIRAIRAVNKSTVYADYSAVKYVKM